MSKLYRDQHRITRSELAEHLQQIADRQDKQSFACVFTYYAPRVKAYMYKLGCSDSLSEELAQQALLQVWQKAHLFNSQKSAPGTWIFCIARNLRIDRLRKEKHYTYSEYEMSDIADTSDRADDIINRVEHADLMLQAISELPVDQMQVIHLSFYEGMSHAEISERLEIALGTVKSRMRLAFKKLRNRMDQML